VATGGCVEGRKGQGFPLSRKKKKARKACLPRDGGQGLKVEVVTKQEKASGKGKSQRRRVTKKIERGTESRTQRCQNQTKRATRTPKGGYQNGNDRVTRPRKRCTD